MEGDICWLDPPPPWPRCRPLPILLPLDKKVGRSRVPIADKRHPLRLLSRPPDRTSLPQQQWRRSIMPLPPATGTARR